MTAYNIIDGTLGTIGGSPVLVSDHLGRSNNAYSFNGSSDYITPSNLGSGYGNFTISGWFNTDTLAVTDGAPRGIIGAQSWSAGKFLLQLKSRTSFGNSNTRLVFEEYTMTAGATQTNTPGATPIQTGTWYHFVVDFNNTTHIAKTYINGELHFTYTSNQSSAINADGYYIGNTFQSAYYDGNISYIQAISNSLSADEVLALYDLTSKDYIYPISYGTLPNLQEGLVMHLDGDGNDLSGNGNNGTPTNVTKVRVNQTEGGIYNGSSSYIDVGTIFAGYSQITFSAWVQFSTLDTNSANRQIIYSNRNDSYSFGTRYEFAGVTTSQLIFLNGQSGKTGEAATWTGPIENGVWYHIVGTLNGATIKLYINGTLVDSQTGDVSGIITTTNPTNIGRYPQGTYYTDSDYYGLKVRNRALSEQEVAQEYYLSNLNTFN